MRVRSVLRLMAMQLASSDSQGWAASPAPEPEAIKAFAGDAGRIVGAAYACRNISADRVMVTVKTIAARVQAQLGRSADLDTASDRFDAATSEGGASVRAGQTSCRDAEQALRGLESRIGP